MKKYLTIILAITLTISIPSGSYGYNDAIDKEFEKMLIGWVNKLVDKTSDMPGGAADMSGMVDELEEIQPLYGAIGTTESHCKFDDDCYACMKEPAERAKNIIVALEKVFVIYKRTMKKYQMMVAIADGAADLAPYAKYAWAIQKGSPNSDMNQAKKAFEEKFDNSQLSKLNKLNTQLVAIGACEQQHLGNANWYNLNGMPLYTQSLIRYKR